MAGQIYSGDNGRYPKIKDARAFCAGRKHHAGDGVANPITENPFDGDGTDEETAWDLGWTARDNGDGKGNCAEQVGDLSPHFDRAEFACKCGCGFDAIDMGLVAILEEIRQQFARPVIVNSGCRCMAHNQAVGGAVASYHLPDEHGLGRAADIRIPNVLADYVADYLEDVYPDKLGIGRYQRWTHVDVGPMRRWRQPYMVVTDT